MGRLFPVSIVILLIVFILFPGCLTPAAEAREWNQRGETHHAMGRYEEAVVAYDRAIAFDPEYGEAWRNRGLSLSLIGRTDDSMNSFSRALEIDPGDIEAWYFQALSLKYLGNTTGALGSLDHAATIRPKSRDDAITLHQALLLQGDLLTAEGRTGEANVSYQRAHEILISTI